MYCFKNCYKILNIIICHKLQTFSSFRLLVCRFESFGCSQYHYRRIGQHLEKSGFCITASISCQPKHIITNNGRYLKFMILSHFVNNVCSFCPFTSTSTSYFDICDHGWLASDLKVCPQWLEGEYFLQ